jgi:hypothetical protein
VTRLVEYRNDETVVPKDLGRGVSAATVLYSDGYETGCKLTFPR